MSMSDFKSVLQIDLRHKGMAILLVFIMFLGVFLYQEAVKVRKEVERIYAGSLLSSISSTVPVMSGSSKIIFVGDIMLDRGVETAIMEYGGGDYKFPFLKTADYLRSADIAVGNLEGPVSDKGYKAGSIYSFRADPEAVEGLESAGFDLVCFANNHVFDYSRDAFEDTMSRLKKAGINYAGAGFSKEEAYSPKTIETAGGKVAFLAFTNLGSKNWEAGEDFSGIAWLDQGMLKAGIKKAEEQADLVVVMFHLGEEYKIFSNSEQKSFARLAIDSGADLVVGHHPHVAQEIEEYKGKYIAYSLGNFVFDQDFSKETMESLALEVSIRDGIIQKVETRKVKLNSCYQPEIVE